MTFGDFSEICKRTPLALCALTEPLNDPSNSPLSGVLPKCYARTVTLANTLIFEIGTAFIRMAILIILLLIVYLVRLRYTSVARREMLFFFWSLIANTIASLIVDTGVSPPGSSSYAYFVSLQLATSATSYWALLFSGISGFGFWEDGSTRAMVALYVSAVGIFIVNYIIPLFTFTKAVSGLGPSKTTALFVLFFIINPLMLVLWLLSQLFICFFMLVINWWALGALSLAVFFFAASQALLYSLSQQICEGLKHYVDGTVFSSLSAMFCIMMVFKYWDIITFDDDEYYRFTEVVPGVGFEQKPKNF
ncbi:hypothetical protein FOA43_001418 [Brettanomyces nanus]|uniref:Chitin synthase export chaperone n=1 Tax=Eeniella nana TaxID=13502 RepID=A0A875RU19_EENNA|nr:uncharacterized protein FOA43_001418 [Brettanomyces nanus]QPG74097.1 hypothetical protein FOA43_001418 [Brettanomyces nanus]